MPTQIGENRAKQMLKANALVLCMGVNQLRTPNIAMMPRRAGSMRSISTSKGGGALGYVGGLIKACAFGLRVAEHAAERQG